MDFLPDACKCKRISIHAPRGGSDLVQHVVCDLQPDFNPRSPRGERPIIQYDGRLYRVISIHAPRGGSDGVTTPDARLQRPITIHAPRGGSDGTSSTNSKLLTATFQSTLPAGGATYIRGPPERKLEISIHAPRGGSDAGTTGSTPYLLISIHAPRGGSDSRESSIYLVQHYISIHAPRGGSDFDLVKGTSMAL